MRLGLSLVLLLGSAPAVAGPEDEAADSTVTESAAGEAAEPEKKKAKFSTVFTDDFELRYWMLDDRLPGFEDRRVLDYVEQVNRFTASVRSGPFSFFGQFDQVALMANTYFLNDERQMERELLSQGLWSPLVPGSFDAQTHGLSGWDLVSRNLYFNFEKLRFGYEKNDVSLSIGDNYVAFGRGIALNVNRNVDIDIDSSLQGVHFKWTPGAWDFTAVFGQLNRQQVFQDNPNTNIPGDRRHMVGGIRLDRYGIGPVNLGAHGVVYNFVDDDGWKSGFEEIATTPDVVVGGANIEIFGPTSDWYFEGDVFGFPTIESFQGEERVPGYALYLSSSIYAGKTTWLIEGKRYSNAEQVNSVLATELYEVGIGPTLEYERAITEDSSATVNSNNIWGGRVRMDWTAIPATLVPFWALGVYRDLEVGGLHFNTVPETVYHPLVGVEWTDGDWAALFNMGYRIDDRDGKEGGADRQLHGDLIGKIPIAGGWLFDISAGIEWYRWGNNRFQQTDYVEMETALTVQKGSTVSFVWYTDYTSNPLINSTGNLAPRVYGAAEVIVKPLPALTVRGFFGAYKAGIRCSGGQCRVLPGFEGARLSMQVAF